MQDIVKKIVPGIETEERRRREAFYSKIGIKLEDVMPEYQKEKPQNSEPGVSSGQSASDATGDCHRSDEQINLHVIGSGTFRSLKRPFIRVSSQATITHLKKYLARRIASDAAICKEIDILCNEELMGKDHSLHFILRTRWRSKEQPLELHYRRRVDMS
jgi:polycomb group RING finger protein 3